MTISELIAALEAIRAEHGDLPVSTWEAYGKDEVAVQGDHEWRQVGIRVSGP